MPEGYERMVGQSSQIRRSCAGPCLYFFASAAGFFANERT